MGLSRSSSRYIDRPLRHPRIIEQMPKPMHHSYLWSFLSQSQVLQKWAVVFVMLWIPHVANSQVDISARSVRYVDGRIHAIVNYESRTCPSQLTPGELECKIGENVVALKTGVCSSSDVSFPSAIGFSIDLSMAGLLFRTKT